MAIQSALKIKLPNRIQLIIFCISAGIMLLNIFQGSQIRLKGGCDPIQLEEGLMYTSIFTAFIFLFLSDWSMVKKYFLPVVLATVIIYNAEPLLSKYQMNVTNSNLQAACDAIYEFKTKNGVLPETINDLENANSLNSGFKIFNDQFIFNRTEGGFTILYEVKYGAICEAWNCHTAFANLKYTCVECGDLEDNRFEAY